MTIVSANVACPAGYRFPTSANGCAEAAANVGHPLTAEVQTQCSSTPCTTADIEHLTSGQPVCAVLPGERFRAVYNPTRSSTSPAMPQTNFKALCVRGEGQTIKILVMHHKRFIFTSRTNLIFITLQHTIWRQPAQNVQKDKSICPSEWL
jgi:hypothetical protein